MGAFKNDAAAQEAWGDAYDNIPKSAFALVAYHLAMACSEQPDTREGAYTRFREEVSTLTESGLIDSAQAKRILAALSKV